MLYDLSNELDHDSFRAKVDALLIGAKDVVELKVKRPRSLSQNAYLHAIFAFVAADIGESTDYVKQYTFKCVVNPDIFIREKTDRWLGRIFVTRSSAELTKEEMSTAITRFRNWAAQECDCYIPTPEEHHLIMQMQAETSRIRAQYPDTDYESNL